LPCHHDSLLQRVFQDIEAWQMMTVEFSNTSAAVWNGIQTALQRAGFMEEHLCRFISSKIKKLLPLLNEVQRFFMTG
jgi:hypothetical protein